MFVDRNHRRKIFISFSIQNHGTCEGWDDVGIRSKPQNCVWCTCWTFPKTLVGYISHYRFPWDDVWYIYLHKYIQKSTSHVGKYTIDGSYGYLDIPNPHLPRVGLMVEKSHPQNRIIGEISFLGHIWNLRVLLKHLTRSQQNLYSLVEDISSKWHSNGKSMFFFTCLFHFEPTWNAKTSVARESPVHTMCKALIHILPWKKGQPSKLPPSFHEITLTISTNWSTPFSPGNKGRPGARPKSGDDCYVLVSGWTLST